MFNKQFDSMLYTLQPYQFSCVFVAERLPVVTSKGTKLKSIQVACTFAPLLSLGDNIRTFECNGILIELLENLLFMSGIIRSLVNLLLQLRILSESLSLGCRIHQNYVCCNLRNTCYQPSNNVMRHADVLMNIRSFGRYGQIFQHPYVINIADICIPYVSQVLTYRCR